MVKVLKDIVLPILIGVLVAFVGALFIPGNFLIHPTFDITPPQSQTSGSQYTTTITNTGLIQGKNVRIGMSYVGNLELMNSDCPEGFTVANKTSTQLLLQLDRMSTQLPCDLTVDLPKGTQLKSIVVTADNSPAYEIKSDENKSSAIATELNWLVPFLIVAVVVSIIMKLLNEIRSV